MIYKEEDLAQNSDEWLEFRKGGIGASEIPAIFGKTPPHWDNPYEVFLRKMGKHGKKANEYMRRGKLLEDQAGVFVKNHLKNCQGDIKMSVFCGNCVDRFDEKIKFDPNFEKITAKYKDFEHIFASFDGVDIDNGLILELKCTQQSGFTKLAKNPKVPKMYFLQIQTQLMVANSQWGIKTGVFANYYPEGVYIKNKNTDQMELIRLVLIKVELDEEISKEIEKTARNFWKMVENKKWNVNWNNNE